MPSVPVYPDSQALTLHGNRGSSTQQLTCMVVESADPNDEEMLAACGSAL